MPTGRNEKAFSELEPGDHFTNLFDTTEDAAGNKVDDATGESIDNSGIEAADETLSEVPHGQEDALYDPVSDDDAAAEFLRNNDPDLQAK